jgi:hypothetical protein
MATKKVSALSALTSPDGAEELLINDGGTSKKVTITNANKKLFSFLDVNGNYIQTEKGGDLTSANPLVIDTDGDYFDVTGTANFASMTVAADRQFTLQFDGVLTMTHHATNLDLPSEANITTAAGDVATFQSTGADTVQCICYTKADGTAVAGAAVDVSSDATPQLGGDLDCNGSQIQWSQGADVASDTALAVLTDGNYFDVTGTTAITSINTTGGVGTLIKLHFDGVLVLTHDATDLILPSGANITTAAGDEAEFIEYATGDYRCTNYSKADGTAVVDANTTYSAGSSSALGLIKLEDDATQTTAASAITTTAARTYGLQVNASGQGVVNVPWSDTDTNTTYSIQDGELSQNNFTNTDHTKLNNIEASADVTDATNVGSVVNGKQTIWVPANAMNPTESNGCAAITAVETTSARPDMQVLDFDKDSDEFAQFTVAFPKSWDLGTVTYQVFWSGIASADDVDWMVDAVAMNDNETIDVAYGTPVVVTDNAQGAVEELLVSDESSAVTIAGTPADNDLTYFRIGRDVSGDAMAGDARLHGVKIFFTTDALNDD